MVFCFRLMSQQPCFWTPLSCYRDSAHNKNLWCVKQKQGITHTHTHMSIRCLRTVRTTLFVQHSILGLCSTQIEAVIKLSHTFLLMTDCFLTNNSLSQGFFTFLNFAADFVPLRHWSVFLSIYALLFASKTSYLSMTSQSLNVLAFR